MHPEPEQKRRSEDQSRAARIAYSPVAGLAHMATTAAVAITLMVFAFGTYRIIYNSQERSLSNEADIMDQSREISQLQKKVTSLERSAKYNSDQIRRVEEQSRRERSEMSEEILSRLQSLNDKVSELNRYLRDEAGKN